MNRSDCCRWCCRETCIIGVFLCKFFFFLSFFKFIRVPTALNIMFVRGFFFPFQANGALRNFSKCWPDQVTDNLRLACQNQKPYRNFKNSIMLLYFRVTELSIQGSNVNHVPLWNTSCSQFGSQRKQRQRPQICRWLD